MAACSDVATAISEEGLGNVWRILYKRAPSLTLRALQLYAIWFILQAMLYAFVPGNFRLTDCSVEYYIT